MNIKSFKTITIISVSAFLLSGCNIYREMTIPTPYYPNKSNNNLGVEANSNTVTMLKLKIELWFKEFLFQRLNIKV